jgi:protein SCO1/2
MTKYIMTAVLLSFVLAGCNQQTENESLPVYGRKKIVENQDGSFDTLYHTIAPFKFVDQDSVIITNEKVEGKIYVADFFFTSCPSICPIMKTQMLRVYDKFKDNPSFTILSHSIDPEYDTVALLKDYAARLGVTDSERWHFLTGSKEEIYNLGQTSYMVTAAEDSDAPGGYIHDGAFLLVDKEGRIRGVYDGTKAEQVDDLMNDIVKLFDEYTGDEA